MPPNLFNEASIMIPKQKKDQKGNQRKLQIEILHVH